MYSVRVNVVTVFQISPQIDPSQNWTLFKPIPILEDAEEEADSLFSSLKTSHSSSLKALHCTCPRQEVGQRPEVTAESPFPPLRRTASFPRCHPKLDPHRFDLNSERPQFVNQSLRQLPTVPPDFGDWQNRRNSVNVTVLPSPPRPLTHYSSTQDFVKISNRPPKRLQHRNASFPGKYAQCGMFSMYNFKVRKTVKSAIYGA